MFNTVPSRCIIEKGVARKSPHFLVICGDGVDCLDFRSVFCKGKAQNTANLVNPLVLRETQKTDLVIFFFCGGWWWCLLQEIPCF